MRRHVLFALTSFAICVTTIVATGIIGGFVMPYLSEVTEITPDRLTIVRANGFTASVAYKRRVARGEDTFEEFALYPSKYVSVTYNSDCVCITHYVRKEGRVNMSLHFDPKHADQVFYTTGGATVPDGRQVTIGAMIPVDRVQHEIAEATMLMDRARYRFAESIPAN